MSRLLWNPKFEFPAHKSTPPGPVLNQAYKVYNVRSYFYMIHFNIIFRRSFKKDIVPLCFPIRIFYAILIFSMHPTCTAHLILHFIVLIVFSGRYKLWSFSLCRFYYLLSLLPFEVERLNEIVVILSATQFEFVRSNCLILECSLPKRGSVPVSAWTLAILCDGFNEFLGGVWYKPRHRVSVQSLSCLWCDSPRPTLTSRNYVHRKFYSNPMLFCTNGANKCLSTEKGVMIEVTRAQLRTQSVQGKFCLLGCKSTEEYAASIFRVEK
jgi:hypothetical protein